MRSERHVRNPLRFRRCHCLLIKVFCLSLASAKRDLRMKMGPLSRSCRPSQDAGQHSKIKLVAARHPSDRQPTTPGHHRPPRHASDG